jgi:hypothetical protein
VSTKAQGMPCHANESHTTYKIKGSKKMTAPKIDLRNSVTECAQSLRKENVGKYQNYTIRDCKASIAAGKMK